jgi:hypothetical protein
MKLSEARTFTPDSTVNMRHPWSRPAFDILHDVQEQQHLQHHRHYKTEKKVSLETSVELQEQTSNTRRNQEELDDHHSGDSAPESDSQSGENGWTGPRDDHQSPNLSFRGLKRLPHFDQRPIYLANPCSCVHRHEDEGKEVNDDNS